MHSSLGTPSRCATHSQTEERHEEADEIEATPRLQRLQHRMLGRKGNFMNDKLKHIKPKIPLRKGLELSIKRHCKGALREVVGYFERMAEVDPTGERFVFAGPEAAIRGISKTHPLSRRSYFLGLAEARALNIISMSVDRIRDHKEYNGVIVTHPEALLVREGSLSVFEGKTDTPGTGRWREDNGVLFWHPKALKIDAGIAPTLHRDCTDVALPLHRDCTRIALKSRNSCTESCTTNCTEHCTENIDQVTGVNELTVNDHVDLQQSQQPS